MSPGPNGPRSRALAAVAVAAHASRWALPTASHTTGTGSSAEPLLTAAHGDLRQRLTDPSNDGRTDLWRVALHGFSASPLHGYGAGMYQTLWDRNRPSFVYMINAHSLYLQAMAELGIPGIALLLILVGAVLVGLGVRARGPRRSIYGALLAACVVWAVHAGVDWDWEMPVVTLGFFAVAGAALSPRIGGSGVGWVPSVGRPLVLGLLCLLALVMPGLDHRLAEPARRCRARAVCIELRDGRPGRAVVDRVARRPPRTV